MSHSDPFSNEGSDTYWCRSGGGQNVINNTDAYAQSQDVLKLGPGISMDPLSSQHVGNELVVGLAGTDDKITATDWCQPEQPPRLDRTRRW